MTTAARTAAVVAVLRDSGAILANGAVLTKRGQIVVLELEGDTGLFYCSNAGGLDTDRKTFDSREERDEALLRTVRLYLGEGWQMPEGGR